MDFPAYRKLSNNKSFYKITSDTSFEEIQLMGSKAFLYEHNVSKYPEILRIKEMLELVLAEILESSEEEYEKLKFDHSL